MDWTDRHCRVFHRTFSRRARLYSEMVTTGAIIHGPRQRLLGFDPSEQSLALQLGGSDPKDLAQCAKIGEDFGYDEINLNCGCPSDRVQNGARVGDCVSAMKASVGIPVTVKCRIGVDDQDPEQALWAMAQSVIAAGAGALIVHARKAWLQGLSPKENRDVPPLDYSLVYRLKAAYPQVPIIINGGITTLDAAQEHLTHLDGVMLGRVAYHEPGLLGLVDPILFGEPAAYASQFEVLEAYLPYIEQRLSEGVRLADMTRHILGLFTGMPGARAWRRHLATYAVKSCAGLDVVRQAAAMVTPAALLPQAEVQLAG